MIAEKISKPIRILHVEDNRPDSDLVRFILKKANINVKILVVEDRKEFIDSLYHFNPDIILSDHTLPSFNSIEVIRILKDMKIDIPVILITGTVSEEFAVLIMKEGASDYLLKDRLERLPIAITQVLEKWEINKDVESIKYALDVSSIVAITDAAGLVISVNQNFCVQSKFAREELIGKDLRMLNSGEHTKNFMRNLWETITNGNLWHGEIKNKAKDGTFYWLDTMITPSLKNGKSYQYIAISTDITERKIAEQEKNSLQTSLEKSLNEIYTFDPITLQFTYGNNGALLNLGYSEKELYALTPLDIKPEHTLATFLELTSPLVNNVKAKIIFFTNHQRKNGSIYPVEVHLQLMLTGNKSQFLAVVLDITERKKAEQELVDSEKKFRLLSRQLDLQNNRLVNAQSVAKTGSWETKIATLDMQWSEETFNIFGLDPKEFNPTHSGFLNLVHPDDRKKVDAAFCGSIGTNTTNSIEHKIYTKSGEEKIVEERWYLEYDHDDKPLKAIGTCQDITSRKKAEIALQYVTERLQLATKAARAGVWDLDLAQDKLIWDDVMFAIYNLNTNDFSGTGQAWSEHLHPEDLEQTNQDLLDAIQGIREFDCTFRIIWKDKSVRYIKGNAIVERDTEGKAVRIIGTNRDITKEKNAEEILELQNLELKKTNSELDKFVYSVSHDLRAPLTSMLGVIDISLKRTHEDQTAERLNMLKKSVNKLDGFILDIINYSRNSRLELKKEKINLKELIDDVFNNLKYIGGNIRQVEFRCKVDEQLSVYSDKIRLNIVLNNLISNAIRYQNNENSNPFVEVQAETTNSETHIRITDNGIGIEKKFRTKIFDMFYKVSDVSFGSGLGLYLVKESLNKLEGSIKVQSVLGKGTSFLIVIPNN